MLWAKSFIIFCTAFCHRADAKVCQALPGQTEMMSLWRSCGVWPSFRSFCWFSPSWTFSWVAAKANMCVYSAINQWPGHNSLGQTQAANNLAQASHTSGVILPQTHQHLRRAAGLCAGPVRVLRFRWQVSSGVRGLAAHFMPVFMPNRGGGQTHVRVCVWEWFFVPTALGLEPISTCSAWAWSVDHLSPCGTCLLFFVSGRRRDLHGPLLPPHLPAISPVIPTLLEQFFYHSIYANVIPADVRPQLKNAFKERGGCLRKIKQTKQKKNRTEDPGDKTHVPCVGGKVIVVLRSFFNTNI